MEKSRKLNNFALQNENTLYSVDLYTFIVSPCPVHHKQLKKTWGL